MHILIVEDDRKVRRLIRELMESLCDEITECEDGDDQKNCGRTVENINPSKVYHEQVSFFHGSDHLHRDRDGQWIFLEVIDSIRSHTMYNKHTGGQYEIDSHEWNATADRVRDEESRLPYCGDATVYADSNTPGIPLSFRHVFAEPQGIFMGK